VTWRNKEKDKYKEQEGNSVNNLNSNSCKSQFLENKKASLKKLGDIIQQESV
jgi:hypothetical protein